MSTRLALLALRSGSPEQTAPGVNEGTNYSHPKSRANLLRPETPGAIPLGSPPVARKTQSARQCLPAQQIGGPKSAAAAFPRSPPPGCRAAQIEADAGGFRR